MWYFLKNKTSLTEEYIAQRLGMIPLWVDPEFFDKLQYFYRTDGNNANVDFEKNIVNENCMVSFELNVLNTSREIISVYDSQITFPRHELDVKPFSVHRNCAPIPILHLGPMQHIHVRGAAFKG